MDIDQKLLNVIARATSHFVLTPEAAAIREWDRVTQVNGVPAEAVIAALVDPYGRRIPETRAVELRVLQLDAVLVLQRCHPVTNAPLYSDADVAWTIEWMRTEMLPEFIADPRKLKALLDGVLAKRVLEEFAAEVRADGAA